MTRRMNRASCCCFQRVYKYKCDVVSAWNVGTEGSQVLRVRVAELWLVHGCCTKEDLGSLFELLRCSQQPHKGKSLLLHRMYEEYVSGATRGSLRSEWVASKRTLVDISF